MHLRLKVSSRSAKARALQTDIYNYIRICFIGHIMMYICIYTNTRTHVYACTVKKKYLRFKISSSSALVQLLLNIHSYIYIYI